MTDFISSIASIMRTEVDQLNSIARNSANSNTVGYRSESQVVNNSNLWVKVVQGSIDLNNTLYSNAQGVPIVTKRNLDVAIAGEGWFSVNGKGETNLLTRNGNLHINEEGDVVTSYGHTLSGLEGIAKNIDIEDIHITKTGSIIVDDEVVGQFRLFNPVNTNQLEYAGSGLYKTSLMTEQQDVQLIVGSLEASNVDTSKDMVRLMEITRHIETMQRAMSSYDEIMEIGINRIGSK